MTTKSQRFKAETQRALQAQKRATNPPKPKRRKPRSKDRIPNQASHNEVTGRRRKSAFGFEFEIAATPRPSLKSTRKSSNRQKSDSGLRIAARKRAAR